MTWEEFKAALPYRAPLRAKPAMMATMKGPKGPPLEAPPPPFMQVEEAGNNADLPKQLLARYGQKGAKGVNRKEIGLDEATFRLLDTDRNGALDAEELAHFTQRPADLELTIRVGKVGPREQRLVMAAGDKPAPLARQVRQTQDGVVLTLDSSQMDLEVKGGDVQGNNKELIRQVYEGQFDQADKDNNGYLDEKEAKKSSFFGNSFKAMDLDGDGKLFKKEMLEYLDRYIELQARALASQLTITTSEAGRGLFDLIDTNRDGRLSVRELRSAVKLLERLDRNGDGFLEAGEVPRTFQVTLTQGSAGNNPFLRTGFDPSQLLKPLPETTAGPLWFRKMDLNRDGDVSRREWIGTQAEFDRIDADGDGLISAAEAEKYDSLKRQRRSDRQR